MTPRIVMDANVLVSALRSRAGASFRLLSLIDRGRFSLCVSVPLVLEYEAATKKISKTIGLSSSDIDDILDYICLVAERYKVYYLWRPMLRDPKDDMVLELAVSSNADAIITYNKGDFKGSEKFGIRIASPKEFLQQIGELS
jgi:putative PIN family toxin of toxin-antitoxin system